MRIRDPQTRHRWRAGRSTRSRSGGTRTEVRAIPHLPEIQRQPPPQTDYQTVSFAILVFNIAARMKSPSTTSNAGHGRVLLMAGRPTDAMLLLGKAVRDDPNWA